MFKISRSVFTMAFLAGVLSACQAAQPGVPPSSSAAQPAAIANPASVNCIRQGGRLLIVTRPDGGQYGICVFVENKQCEEWAMFRGECPVGGVDVSAWKTDAAKFCVLTGGQYKESGDGDGQADCTLPAGKTCPVLDYFQGKCSADDG
jgi:putative hemolysin